MISITVSNATLILGAHVIFRDLSWDVQHDQKIGLIGPNGAGKSSLFKLITGEHTPEKGGMVIKAKGVTLGYLPQQPEFDPQRTALSLALEGNPRLLEVEAELQRVESRLGEPDVYNNPKALERALEAQTKLLEEFESLGGSNYEFARPGAPARAGAAGVRFRQAHRCVERRAEETDRAGAPAAGASLRAAAR